MLCVIAMGFLEKGIYFLRVLVVFQKVVDCGSECINVVVGAMRCDKKYYDYWKITILFKGFGWTANIILSCVGKHLLWLFWKKNTCCSNILVESVACKTETYWLWCWVYDFCCKSYIVIKQRLLEDMPVKKDRVTRFFLFVFHNDDDKFLIMLRGWCRWNINLFNYHKHYHVTL